MEELLRQGLTALGLPPESAPPTPASAFPTGICRMRSGVPPAERTRRLPALPGSGRSGL